MPYQSSSPNNPARTLETLPRALISAPEGQEFIRRALRNQYQIRCGCRPVASSPLIVHKYSSGNLHLARRKGTEGEHSPRCFHSGIGNLAAALGLPNGSVVERDGELVIDFGLLLATDNSSSGTGGSWPGEANHCPRLYSLGWLLLEEAGLNQFGNQGPTERPWATLCRALHAMRAAHFGSASASNPLEQCTLLPLSAYDADRNPNQAKAKRAAGRTRKNGRPVVGQVLFMALLPETRLTTTNEPYAQLRDQLGIGVAIFSEVLGKAQRQCQEANGSFEAGRPVLAVGIATVKVAGKWLDICATQLALIPVGSALTPTPTESHWHELDAAVESRSPYFVEAQEDMVIALRCSPKLGA